MGIRNPFKLLLLLSLLFGSAYGSGLNPYSCLSRNIDVKLWMTQFDRKLDSSGIVKQNNQYHPLTIAFYGVLQFDEFQKHGDSLSELSVINQFKYFADNKLVEYDAEEGEMRLPYRFNFADLKSPWYSGMTQGAGISYMLRYHALTGDERGLIYAKALASFMLKSVADGGTIGKTKEGLAWIEEYPNSKRSPQVLNGFINGLIGLKEYVDFFPEDTLAKRIHDECYNALITTTTHYDEPEATNYCRKQGNHCNNQYLRYELSEFEHLFELYGDTFFIEQMKIWAWMAEGKLDKQLKFIRNPEYQFGRSLIFEDYSGKWKVNEQFENGLIGHDSLNFGELDFDKKAKGKSMGSLSLPMSFQGKKLKNNHLLMEFDLPVQHVGITFPEKSKDLAFWGLDHRGNRVTIDTVWRDGTIWLGSLRPLKAILIKPKNRKKRKWIIESVRSRSVDDQSIPKFLHHFDKDRKFVYQKGDRIQFNLPGSHVVGMRVFWRHAAKTNELIKAKWKVENSFIPNGNPFILPNDGAYQFLFSFPYMFPQPEIEKFGIERCL